MPLPKTPRERAQHLVRFLLGKGWRPPQERFLDAGPFYDEGDVPKTQREEVENYLAEKIAEWVEEVRAGFLKKPPKREETQHR